jgi:hypothetical protein
MKNYFYELPFELQLYILSFIPRFRQNIKSRQERLLKYHVS